MTEAFGAADLVASRAGLWLPGALAWCLTVGWIPLLVAVGRPPTVTDLTFLGARVYTSGDWPWNAVTAAAGALILVAIAFVLVALAETVLTAAVGRRTTTTRSVVRLLGIGFITTSPVLAALLATATAFVMVAVREFNAPGVGDPLLRTVGRVVPFLVAVAATWVLAGAAHAAASRSAVLGGAGLVDALLGVPRRLGRAAVPALVHVLAVVGLRAAYLAVATVLLTVLWQPIGTRLAAGRIDATVVPLLVGFVAIWLCLVLGGGALHAWGSVTWTRVLGARAPRPGGAEQHAHGDPHRS